ncbi:M90 family metallopeptidase [Massilia sp. W12]|uniref:M90 family metallopeptidase n=1 Tax=Massilia sp. W12 TaxID=3126507 RepID=UPI0030D1BDC6
MNIWIVLLLCAIPPLFGWYLFRAPRRRHGRLSKQQRRLLAQAIPGWRNMATPTQRELQHLTWLFLQEKRFVGCDGLQVTEAMRVSIAGLACMLVMRRETALYPRLSHIMLYPDAFIAPRKEQLPGGVVQESRQTLAGESWDHGQVVLSWRHVQEALAEPDSGHNVVWHEFAHQLDSENGPTNGAPQLPGRRAYQTWAALMQEEFNRLRQAVDHGLPTALDPYGAQNPAEFFAVACEAFFGRPHQLARLHASLYALLADYFRVDPRHWMEDRAPQEDELPGYFSVH